MCSLSRTSLVLKSSCSYSQWLEELHRGVAKSPASQPESSCLPALFCDTDTAINCYFDFCSDEGAGSPYLLM